MEVVSRMERAKTIGLAHFGRCSLFGFGKDGAAIGRKVAKGTTAAIDKRDVSQVSKRDRRWPEACNIRDDVTLGGKDDHRHERATETRRSHNSDGLCGRVSERLEGCGSIS